MQNSSMLNQVVYMITTTHFTLLGAFATLRKQGLLGSTRPSARSRETIRFPLDGFS